MRPTPRTQPYRVGPRMPGMALDAMRLGRQPGMLNGADFNRQRLAGTGLQQLVKQRMRERPSATGDARGIFMRPPHPLGHVPGQQISLQQLLMLALSMPPRVR